MARVAHPVGPKVQDLVGVLLVVHLGEVHASAQAGVARALKHVAEVGEGVHSGVAGEVDADHRGAPGRDGGIRFVRVRVAAAARIPLCLRLRLRLPEGGRRSVLVALKAGGVGGGGSGQDREGVVFWVHAARCRARGRLNALRRLHGGATGRCVLRRANAAGDWRIVESKVEHPPRIVPAAEGGRSQRETRVGEAATHGCMARLMERMTPTSMRFGRPSMASCTPWSTAST